MKHCTQCGHVLGLGRFCTNCGHPVAVRTTDPLSDPLPDTPPPDAPGDQPEGWRTDTAERPPRQPTPDDGAVAVPAAPSRPPAAPNVARVPPAAVEPPPPPRFPLFADEVAAAEPAPPVVVPATPAQEWAADWAEDPDEDWDDWEDGRRSRTVWVVGALVVLVALVGGAWFLGQLVGGDDDRAEDPAADGPRASQEPVDHTADATAQAPRTAPPTEDVDGNPTSYDASNMLDGVPETAWRAAGDGSGLKLVFTFDDKVTISEVGLINGYAKTATDESGKTFDWYAGHRRITEVTWNFGVGPVVRQDLKDSRDLQTMDVDPVETRKLVLKIVATTPPGSGPAARNFTAISEVHLAG